MAYILGLAARAGSVPGGTWTITVRVLVAALALIASGSAAYTVVAGDTLSSIASRNGSSVRALAEANGITNPDRIFVGQQLVIPGQAPAPTTSTTTNPPGGGTYVVQPGDTLATIAARHGLTVAELARANGITDPNRILGGTLLRIATAPAPTPGTAGGGDGTHTVRSGETLSGIAGRYGVGVAALAAANGITNPDLVRIGQTLVVPGAAATTWVCPVPGGTWIDDFGVAKPDGRRHEGIDVFAPRGTVVRAPVAGVVTHQQGARAGLQFTLVGDDGYTYIGTHLESWGAAGRVAAGDALGQVGTSGNAQGTPPHVHFEMHHGGVVNPYQTLVAHCG